MTYYAVCNVGGPISVRLDAETIDEALAAFAALDGRAAIDAASAHAEDDLLIEDAAEMGEDEFAGALRARGGELVRDLDAVANAHAGTVAHLAGGWSLWQIAATTDEQIQALRTEAGAAGDAAQVDLCERALAGDATARATCADAIADAAAQDDTRYMVVPAPGHYGDEGRVLSSHVTLAAARRACGKTETVRVGDKRRGDRWLRVYEQTYPEAR